MKEPLLLPPSAVIQTSLERVWLEPLKFGEEFAEAPQAEAGRKQPAAGPNQVARHLLPAMPRNLAGKPTPSARWRKRWCRHRCCEDSAIQNVWGFPGGAVVESLPAEAGDTGSSPGLGRSHVPRSSWAREPQLLSLRVWSLCSATGEAAMVRGPRTAMRSGPRLPQLEKTLAQKRRPNTAINK